MSPSANEGDDDMHEPPIRSPSAPFQHAGAEGSRGVSAWEPPRRALESRGVRPHDSRFNHRFEPEPELNSNNTPKPAQHVFTLKIQSLYAWTSSFSRPSPKKVPSISPRCIFCSKKPLHCNSFCRRIHLPAAFLAAPRAVAPHHAAVLFSPFPHK